MRLQLCKYLGLMFALLMVNTQQSAWAETDTVLSKWVKLPISATSERSPRGLFLVPQNNYGDIPAIVLLGDCDGPQPFQKTWAHRLASQGYVTFLLDPGFQSANPTACRTGQSVAPLLRSAYDYMKANKQLRISTYAVINWNEQLPHGLGEIEKDIAAAVSFYPDCNNPDGIERPYPQLILATQDKDIRSSCRNVVTDANRRGSNILLRIYPGAPLGFDNPNASDTQEAKNPTYGYDRAAHQDSVKRVSSFLNTHLQVTLVQAYPSKAFSPLPPQLDQDESPAITTGYGTWTHDPTQPGTNIPPVGRSLFDRVFSKRTPSGAIYDLPDSYEGIIARIKHYVSGDLRGLGPIKQVLIPHGRSLQREAAKPFYYHHPRIVAAVDGEPEHLTSEQPILLKNRLFLGYQETAKVLEVISYNEAAMRFEFQVVTNFGPGLTPDVKYSDRQLCTSCHQNGAPLFPREEWQETNGSRDTKNQLQTIMKQYHGVAVDRGGEIPAAIDVATDRANLLPVLQRLWREGCGDDDSKASNNCRASAFAAMLQYRLSNDNNFDRNDPVFETQYTQRLTKRWRKFWPNGLYISNSDIPDRNPTIDASIFGLRDPLTPRVPMEIWSGFKRSDLERMIVAMSEDLPHRDIRKLDQWVVDNSAETASRSVIINAPCRFVRQLRRGLEFPLSVSCKTSNFTLSGALSDWDTLKPSGEIIDIQFNDFAIRDRQNLVQTIAADQSRRAFKVYLNENFMRLPDGHRLARIEFSLDNRPLLSTATGSMTLTIQDDFSAIRKALMKISGTTFNNAPFHGPKLMSSLFQELGAEGTDWCCSATAPAPMVKLDQESTPVETVKILSTHNPEHIFAKYCSRCHRTLNRVPANFLHGDRQTIATNLDHCAPRMAYRLSMWDVPVHERTRSPMPPESALPTLGLTKTQWRNSQELATLRRYVESLLPTERDTVAIYDQLQNCLADHEQARLPN